MFFTIKTVFNSEYFYCLASIFYFLNGWIIFFFLIKVMEYFKFTSLCDISLFSMFYLTEALKTEIILDPAF